MKYDNYYRHHLLCVRTGMHVRACVRCVQYSYCEKKSQETLLTLLADAYVQQVIDTTTHIVHRSADIKITNWLRENVTSSE